MQVRYVIDNEELVGLITEGLQRRGMILSRNTTVQIQAGDTIARNASAVVYYQTTLPKEKEKEAAAEFHAPGNPAGAKRGPRTDLERLGDNE